MMNIQLRFLLAYSLFLNPIEKMFSVLKKELQEDSICNRIATVPALISLLSIEFVNFGINIYLLKNTATLIWMLILHSGFLICEIACAISNQNTLANLLALLPYTERNSLHL